MFHLLLLVLVSGPNLQFTTAKWIGSKNIENLHRNYFRTTFKEMFWPLSLKESRLFVLVDAIWSTLMQWEDHCGQNEVWLDFICTVRKAKKGGQTINCEYEDSSGNNLRISRILSRKGGLFAPIKRPVAERPVNLNDWNRRKGKKPKPSVPILHFKIRFHRHVNKRIQAIEQRLDSNYF